MVAGNYWTRVSTGRLSRRAALGHVAAGSAGLALAACSSSNKKAATSAPAATRAAASGTAGGAASPAASATRAAASPAAGAASAAARDLRSLADKDLLAALPQNPPRDWTDAQITPGGTVRVLYAGEPPTLDFMATSGIGIVFAMTGQVYNRLIRFGSVQGMKSVVLPDIQPDLAASWERPDQNTLTFKLQPGIKWQNLAPLGGRPMTVDDIVYSFTRQKTFEKGQYKDHFAYFDKVEGVDPTTVRLTLGKPHPAVEQLLASQFTMIMPHEIGDNPDTAAKTAVGTGGFILDKVTPNVEYVFRKNPDFWKKDSTGRQRPYLDGFTFASVTDISTRQNQFMTGNADLYHGSGDPNISPDSIKQFVNLNPMPLIQALPLSYGGVQTIGHYNKPPWNDVRVRRAFSMAVDPRSDVNNLFKGFGSAQFDFPWPSFRDTVPTFDDLGQWYKYNPQAAKQLLAAAGYPNGIEFALDWTPVYSTFTDEGPLWQQQAQAAGIKITLQQSSDLAAHVQKLVSKSWKDLILDGRALLYMDPMSTVPRKLPGAPLNFAEVDDPKLTDYFQRQLTLSGDQRKALLKEMWQYQGDQVYEVPIGRINYLYTTQAWVKNFVDNALVAKWSEMGGAFDEIWRKK